MTVFSFFISSMFIIILYFFIIIIIRQHREIEIEIESERTLLFRSWVEDGGLFVWSLDE